MDYFCADHHFFHEDIIQMCNRPYKNQKEMEHGLIANHNEIVKPKDLVYFIGDLTLVKNRAVVRTLLAKMNGVKILILGNHDRLGPFDYVDCGFQTVHTAMKIDTRIGEIGLAHDPATAAVNSSIPWICGHVHNLFHVIGNVINVGVDVNNYYPVSFEKIMELKLQCKIS